MARILLIDDKSEIIDRFKPALEKVGHYVVDANWTKGIERVLVQARDEGTPFDLIVCDNNVEMIDDGVELAQKLRQINDNIPFILHTQDPPWSIRADLGTLAVEYVVKAEHVGLLLPAVDKLLGK